MDNSIYRIGSISKIYTATIALKLVEEGLLKLDSKLSDFYPEVPTAEKITIQHLLQHRSGLTNITSVPEYNTYFESKVSEQEMIGKIINYGSNFYPGSKSEYSNSGYIMLTYVIQKASGETYSDLLKKHITIPLKLKTTFVFSKEHPQPLEVSSYYFTGSWETATDTHQSVPLGAGAIAATSRDVGLFLDGLMKGKILSLETLEIMKNTVDRFGMGLFKSETSRLEGYGHTGGIDGFTTTSFYYEKVDSTITVLSNGNYFSMSSITKAAIAAIQNKPIDLPLITPVHTASLETKKAYVGLFKSSNLPLDIKIFLKDNNLFAQATGQSAFPLIARSDTDFEYAPFGIEIKFSNEENFILKQGGGNYNYQKEKLKEN